MDSDRHNYTVQRCEESDTRQIISDNEDSWTTSVRHRGPRLVLLTLEGLTDDLTLLRLLGAVRAVLV
jgi:hypothetical protein